MIASAYTYTYTFIDERNLFWHSLVFSAADRESAYVIDGLMRNDVVKSDIHSTDTHGFSEAIFAVTHLLGISFAPRIKNLKKQTLYMFRSRRGGDRAGWAIKPEQYVDPDAIVADWDDILRLVATIKLKEGTASDIFRRLNSYSRQHSPYTALKAFGRIIKSIFILRYIDDVELRMVIENLLNGSNSAIGLRARSRSATRVSSLPVIRRSRRSPKPAIDSSRTPSFAGTTCCSSIASIKPPQRQAGQRSGRQPQPTIPSSHGGISTCWESTTSPMRSSRIRSASHPPKKPRNRRLKLRGSRPQKTQDFCPFW